MGLLTTIIPKDKDKDKPLDGSGITLVATTQDLTIRTGVDQEIVYNLLNHAFLLKMITPWIYLLLSAKPLMTKNVKNIERLVNALNAENKATLSATVLTKRHALVQLIQFKLKMTISQLSL